MTTLREAAQQALAFTMRDFATMRDFEAARAVLHDDLRAALKQEEEASAWLSERKEHWRKEREKMQATKDQDPELSAALGWPGGASDPALDRTRLLQMVAALRLAAQQALEALGLAKLNGKAGLYPAETEEIADAITALRAALAQQDEPVTVSVDALAQHIRVIDGNHSLGAGALAEKIVEFLIKRGIGKESGDAGLRAALAQQAEPVAWGCNRYIEDDNGFQIGTDDPELAWGRFAPDDNGWWPLYTAPPQRKPLVDPAEYDDAGAAERYNRGLK